MELGANPLNGEVWQTAGILGMGFGLEDGVEIAGRSVPRRGGCASPTSTRTDLTRAGRRVAGASAPGKRRTRRVSWNAIRESRRRIASVIYVTHDLVQAEPGFLERGQQL